LGTRIQKYVERFYLHCQSCALTLLNIPLSLLNCDAMQARFFFAFNVGMTHLRKFFYDFVFPPKKS